MNELTDNITSPDKGTNGNPHLFLHTGTVIVSLIHNHLLLLKLDY